MSALAKPGATANLSREARPVTQADEGLLKAAGRFIGDEELEAAGSWDKVTAGDHINFKELYTVLNAILCFKERLKGQSVQFVSDSITAVSYLNNMGGPVPRLTALAESIWEVQLTKKIP